MKYLKPLALVFVISLALSACGLSAKTMYYVGYVRNETVPGNNGDWETRKFEIRSEKIGAGYDFLYQTSVSRDVDVRVRYYSNESASNAGANGYWQRLKTTDGEKQLSFNTNHDALFVVHSGYYTLQFSTDLLHFGKTTVNNAEWWVDDRT